MEALYQLVDHPDIRLEAIEPTNGISGGFRLIKIKEEDYEQTDIPTEYIIEAILSECDVYKSKKEDPSGWGRLSNDVARTAHCGTAKHLLMPRDPIRELTDEEKRTLAILGIKVTTCTVLPRNTSILFYKGNMCCDAAFFYDERKGVCFNKNWKQYVRVVIL